MASHTNRKDHDPHWEAYTHSLTHSLSLSQPHANTHTHFYLLSKAWLMRKAHTLIWGDWPDESNCRWWSPMHRRTRREREGVCVRVRVCVCVCVQERVHVIEFFALSICKSSITIISFFKWQTKNSSLNMNHIFFSFLACFLLFHGFKSPML